jgi:hypothetical protein
LHATQMGRNGRRGNCCVFKQGSSSLVCLQRWLAFKVWSNEAV